MESQRIDQKLIHKSVIKQTTITRDNSQQFAQGNLPLISSSKHILTQHAEAEKATVCKTDLDGPHWENLAVHKLYPDI